LAGCWGNIFSPYDFGILGVSLGHQEWKCHLYDSKPTSEICGGRPIFADVSQILRQ
jgi:hypothetical protein